MQLGINLSKISFKHSEGCASHAHPSVHNSGKIQAQRMCSHRITPGRHIAVFQVLAETFYKTLQWFDGLFLTRRQAVTDFVLQTGGQGKKRVQFYEPMAGDNTLLHLVLNKVDEFADR